MNENTNTSNNSGVFSVDLRFHTVTPGILRNKTFLYICICTAPKWPLEGDKRPLDKEDAKERFCLFFIFLFNYAT